MRTTTTIAVVAAVFALLIVAKSRTVGSTEVTGSTARSTISAADVERMKNLPPLPNFPPP
jgi:hypothetical protein